MMNGRLFRTAGLSLPITLMTACAMTGGGSRPAERTRDVTVSAVDAGKRLSASSAVVTSASSLASDAGVATLRAGGNAVDAAVATAFALGVVEPQMSGLGGGGAATIWMAGERRPAYLDFYAAQFAEAWRGTAALTRPPQRAGSPEPDLRSVGVPGAVAGLLALHERYGRLPREQVIAPAIELADEGFPVGKVLADFIAGGEERMKPYPGALALYFPEGKPLAPGSVLRNPGLAESLRRIAEEGRRGFYEGPIAAAVTAVMNTGGHPARVTDLAAYVPQWRAPLCTDYRGLTVLSAPPPQTGARVLHTLELLEPFDVGGLDLPTRSALAFDVLTSAMRVGQAGARGNGDPNWMAVPARGIASEAFARTRRSLVGTGTAAASIDPADPAAFDAVPPPGECARYEVYGAAETTGFEGDAERESEPRAETTHLSVVDASGNAVALTVTNSSVWGSGAFAAGFFLNDSGFRFTPSNIDARSRSPWRARTTTIAPTIVVKDGAVQMVIGAPGGSRIPTEIVQVMVYTIDYGLDPLDAVRMPRIFASAADPRVQVEHGFSPELLRAVRAMGYEPVTESSGYARLYLIVRRNGRWIAVADTRHDGEPRGY